MEKINYQGGVGVDNTPPIKERVNMNEQKPKPSDQPICCPSTTTDSWSHVSLFMTGIVVGMVVGMVIFHGY